jgi:tetratricopeptide (TPR) repeat protein
MKSWFEARAASRRRPADLIARGNEARDARSWADAAEAFKAALELDPSLDAIWVQLGHAQKEQGDLQSAEQCYRRAIALNNSSSDSFVQLGHCLKLMGRKSSAVDAYLNAIARDPENADAQIELETLTPSFAAKPFTSVSGKLGTKDIKSIRTMIGALRASGADGYELFLDPVFRAAPAVPEAVEA